jgi:hypothetical protein
MAVHDDRRSPGDYIRNARTRYEESRTGTGWAAVLAGLAVLAVIAYMLFAGATTDRTGEAVRQTPNTGPTNIQRTAPSTTPSTAPTTQPK